MNQRQVDKLLSRLNGVVEVTPERWKALCPAHNDKTPSLSIRLSDDDKVLIYCWSGCGSAAVIEAVGLEFSDLMPNGGYRKSGRINHWHTAREGFKAIRKDLTIVLMCADNIVNGIGVSKREVEYMWEAASRLRAASDAVR